MREPSPGRADRAASGHAAFSGARLPLAVEAEAGAVAAPARCPAAGFRRLLRSRTAALGLAMVSVVVLTAGLAPVLAPAHPDAQDLLAVLEGPSRRHWLGTDQLGRDQLSRVIYGARPAVVVGLGSVPIAAVLAMVVGGVAGYAGGRWDAVMMRLVDALSAFPSLIGVFVILLVIGHRALSVILSVAIFGWTTMARVLRSSILSVREEEYVEAATALGAPGWQILARHILPNSLAPLLILAAVKAGTAVLFLTALSFLGVGFGTGVADWGVMIADGQRFFGTKDHLWLFPSVAVAFTVLGLILFSDGVRDTLDPKLR